jgi:hypothetical protein
LFKKEKEFKNLEKVCLRKRNTCTQGVARHVFMFELWQKTKEYE